MREVESRNGSVAGADAEWFSGASVFETWNGQILVAIGNYAGSDSFRISRERNDAIIMGCF